MGNNCNIIWALAYPDKADDSIPQIPKQFIADTKVLLDLLMGRQAFLAATLLYKWYLLWGQVKRTGKLKRLIRHEARRANPEKIERTREITSRGLQGYRYYIKRREVTYYGTRLWGGQHAKLTEIETNAPSMAVLISDGLRQAGCRRGAQRIRYEG